MADMQKTSIRVGKKAFIIAFAILLMLMIVSGILTRVIQPGSYERFSFEGREMVRPGSFRYVDAAPLPVWRWFTSPFEVLGAEGNIPIITIILFLIFVGGAFAILELAGVMRTILDGIVDTFRSRKYLLMGIIIFFFMAAASVLGIYESMVPLIVFIVPLAHILGWDSMTGLGMSLLPMAFGFSAAITNPFTIGVAQTIAELPLFSGAWLRIIFFILVFASVYLFVKRYAKKVEADPTSSIVYNEDSALRERYGASGAESDTVQVSRGMKRAIIWFSVCMGLAFAFILATAIKTSLSDYAFPLMALLFLIGGVGSGLFAGLRTNQVARAFFKGFLGIAPGIMLILMAMSVKFIVTEGGIMDTILFEASKVIEGTSRFTSALMIYLLTLLINFFIGSASAKAFLMMPILTPLADLVNVSRQTVVLAFDMGDGFSNMIFPSNALLLIALGFTVVNYGKWMKWTLILQGVMVFLSVAFIGIAVLVNFGPF